MNGFVSAFQTLPDSAPVKFCSNTTATFLPMKRGSFEEVVSTLD